MNIHTKSLIILCIFFTHVAISNMPPHISNHMNEIYEDIFLLRHADLARWKMDSFSEKHSLSIDDFVLELCVMLDDGDFSPYREGDRFRNYLIQSLGKIDSTNSITTLITILHNDIPFDQAMAAVSLLRITGYSNQSFEEILPYTKTHNVTRSVLIHIDDMIGDESISQDQASRMISFMQSLTQSATNNVLYVDKLLCRECPNYPESDLRKAMFQRLGRPIPGSEQTKEVQKEEPALSEENATEEECEKQSKCRNTWLIGTLAGIIAGGFWALYWKASKRKHAGVA